MHGLPKYEGHLAGYSALKEVVIECVDRGVKYISVYAFSTENWKRAEEEVSYLMNLVLNILKSDIQELLDNEIRVVHVGAKKGLSEKVTKALEEIEEKSKDFTRGTVGLCFNYGGQREIVDAVKQCLAEGIGADDITESVIEQHLYAPEIPAIDMVVRTSGEQRSSNFMLWRAAYSEYLFIDKLWPDMTKDDVTGIIKEYNNRQRRFGAG